MNRRWFIVILLGVFILIGFGLRLTFIYSYIFHSDEFISLLTASQIIKLGLPLFPSGRVDDTGLLYSYVAAIFALGLGSNEVMVRWASLWFSILIIPLSYQVVRRIVLSSWAGILAALTMAFHSESILWGGRVRMYSMGQFLYFLALLFICTGFTKPNRTHRFIGYTFLLLGLYTHFVLILVIPPIALALCLTVLSQGQFKWQTLRRKGLIGEIALCGASVMIVLVINQFSSIADIAATSDLDSTREPVNLFRVVSSVLHPAVWDGLDSIWHYLWAGPEKLLAIMAGFSLCSLVWRYATRNWSRADNGALFVALSALLLILEMVTLLGGRWRHGRYYFVVLFPLLMITAAYSIRQLSLLSEYLLSYLRSRQLSWLLRPLPAGLLSIWIVMVSSGTIYAEFTETFKTYRYDLAWRYVAQEIAPDDTTMASWPAAASLYNQQIDYYANQTGPVVMSDPTGSRLVDKYARAILVHTSAELNELLAQPGRTWFVIEDAHLFNFLELDFIEQVFQQMKLDRSFDNIHVFVEKGLLQPLPEQPDYKMEVNLSNQMILTGYTIQPNQPTFDRPVILTLFWQPVAPLYNYKIFVHLRNASGDIVAQADYLPLEGTTVDLRGWVQRKGFRSLRTANTLEIPPVLPEGSYSLFVGLYEPFTFQRAPVNQDSSGENAIKLATFQISSESLTVISD